MRLTTVAVVLAVTASAASLAFAQDPDIVDDSVLASATSKDVHVTAHDLTNGQAHARFGIAGIDSIPNFNLHFFADGVDSNGNPNRHWYTNTVGNPPQMGGTTVINAPLQPSTWNCSMPTAIRERLMATADLDGGTVRGQC